LQFMLADTYVDDGISGATAEKRHEFQRLIEDVKAGIINCVITNDTSRFARNVADAEYYVNTVFPTHDTRFIALGSPRIDSYEDPESVDGMQFHFENYFNEYYVKMTSKKIRKVFDMKTKRGEFIGSYAPYGYAKDPDNKNKLIVDEEAAEIVKRIFSMFVYDKLSLRAVAMRLNDMGVLPPREYKITKGITPNSRPAKIPSWHYNTVKIILGEYALYSAIVMFIICSFVALCAIAYILTFTMIIFSFIAKKTKKATPQSSKRKYRQHCNLETQGSRRLRCCLLENFC